MGTAEPHHIAAMIISGIIEVKCKLSGSVKAVKFSSSDCNPLSVITYYENAVLLRILLRIKPQRLHQHRNPDSLHGAKFTEPAVIISEITGTVPVRKSIVPDLDIIMRHTQKMIFLPVISR